MSVAQFVVEIAADPSSRERGLMDRRAFPSGTNGMLFLFDVPQAGDVAFWNKRTYLPLDLLLIDEQGTIVMMIPMQTIEETGGRVTSYPAHTPYIAALELQRGLVGPEVVGGTLITSPQRLHDPQGLHVRRGFLSPYGLPDGRRLIAIVT